MRRSRRIALAVGVLLVGSIVGLWRWRAVPLVRPPRAPLSRHGADIPPGDRRVADLPAQRPPAPAQQPQSNLTAATAQGLRSAARYPRSSQPIKAGAVDPIVRDREVSRNVFPGPEGSGPALTVFPGQVSFEHPDPVELYAYLSEADRAVPAGKIDGVVVDQSGQRLADLAYTDDGRAPDREAGDSVYSARLPDDVSAALQGGPYLVRIHAVTTAGDERYGSTGFLYSRPDAQLTGRYEDALVAGNLEVQTEVDVQTAGRFHVEATLYTQSGKPIAWAQNALVLAPGQHNIPLSFYGLILREHAEDGPYVLRYVALSTATKMPNALNRLAENVHVTRGYSATEFSNQPYADPRLIAAADRLDGGTGSNSEIDHAGGPSRD